MKAHTLVPHPMTPPDDPPEPDLSAAHTCPTCGFVPGYEQRIGYGLRLRCQAHLISAWADDMDHAIDYWNQDVEERKGERLKAEGQEQVAENNEAWMDKAVGKILKCAKLYDAFTVEDVRSSDIAEPKSPNAWGAAFSVAAKQGLIVRVGYAKNKLSSAHSRTVSVWKGKS